MTHGYAVAVVETVKVTLSPMLVPLVPLSVTMTSERLPPPPLVVPPPPLPPPLPPLPDGALASSAEDLARAADPFLGNLAELLRGVGAEIGEAPAAVFLTGGMSRAPYVRETVRQCFPHARQVAGDASLGVVSGLAFAAAREA